MKEENRLEKENPYLYNFASAINKEFPVVNMYVKTRGFFDSLIYFNKADLFFLNWVENLKWYNLPVLSIFLILAKIKSKKIIWTHHNLEPHKGKSWVSNIILKIIQNLSYRIIFHTNESFNYIDPKFHKKCYYIVHPFFYNLKFCKDVENYDLLIWGQMRKSKGVENFIEFMIDTNCSLKVLIVGKFQSLDYFNEIKSKTKILPNIILKNCFLNDKELFEVHSQSKHILFIYNGRSVLNSGALIKSLSTGRNVIGPRRGAFIDYFNLGFVKVFDSFENIVSIVNSNAVINNELENVNRLKSLDSFIQENSWNNFGKKVKDIL
ncbi:hypothetical protein ACFRAE_10790 [Sphingobacterium sp. HJSM2_6]|uniref:hypothetical protein n=1 Tax=Sphingobacterium sp. HJSM2_6 TaxID=3366264 RepID=UPI003BDC7A06